MNRKFVLGVVLSTATAVSALVGGATLASAQWMPGPVMSGPVFVPPGPPMVLPAPMPFAESPNSIPVPGILSGINPYGHDAWGVMGPALGAGTTAVLQPYVPGPVAVWAGDRVNANAQSAYREQGPVNQAIRTFTGVSVQDIQDHGILGGDCSFLRNPFGSGC